nr:hypothetical protein [Candidatus Enterousia merdequi]
MLKRLLLSCVLAILYVLPGLSVVLENPKNTKCNNSILGVYSGNSVLEAIWIPNVYQCAAGTYFDAQTAKCSTCLDGSYCPGVENVEYNGEDAGQMYCDAENNEGWRTELGAFAQSQCYKEGTTTCSEQNPYNVAHGTPIYETTESFACRTYFGQTNCAPVSEVSCGIASLTCEKGYIQNTTEAGSLVCVENITSCAAGTYFNGTAIECSSCPDGSYCPGVETVEYNGEDAGQVYCDAENNEGWRTELGAFAQSQCYKEGTTTCSEQNPYDVAHGTPIYETTESFACRTYFGQTNCAPVSEVSCGIASLTCEKGYKQDTTEDGSLVCVEKVKTCAAGTYFNASTVECTICPDGSYCPGVENLEYNGEDAGQFYCDAENNEGWRTELGAYAQSQCYKESTTTCAEQNPYDVAHGTPVYETTESFACRDYFGQTKCTPVNEVACGVTSLICEEDYRQDTTEYGSLVCELKTKECKAGTYLPVGVKECVICPEDSYCPGKVYVLKDYQELDGVNICPNGLKSPVGARSENDCGRILHVGDDIIHMHQDKRSERSFVVEVAGVKYYADTTPVANTVTPITMNPNTDKTLRVNIDGIEHFVHETIYSDND